MRYIFFLLFFAFELLGTKNIYLKNDSMLSANILRENSENLLIDLGYQVLVIPRSSILKIEDSKTKLKIDEGKKESEFYHVNQRLKRKTIKKLVPELSEAVVVVNTPSGLGTGFLINEDGYLITNYHVIEREKNIKITMFLNKKKNIETMVYRKIRIIAYNPFMDLALLKIDDVPNKKFKYLNLGEFKENKVGDTVFAIGTPLGLERSVTQGIISLLSRNYNGVLYLQTTAPINPGNSGGPLFNLKGEVVGVTNMGYIFSDGLGFAIPVDYLKHFIKNRDAFYYNSFNSNTGVRYLKPPRKSK